MTATSISTSSVIVTGAYLKMSELDDAMMQHMRYIVFTEKRPFSHRDFLSFEVNDKEYAMKHGTFRNKVSNLMKIGEVAQEYRSSLAFYSIKDVRFGKRKSNAVMQSMTSNHEEVPYCHCHCHHLNENVVQDTNPPIYNIIENLPLDKKSLHDIHMRFEMPNIHSTLSLSMTTNSQQQLQMDSFSKDIVIPPWKINDLDIKVIVHRTNTVSVVVGCSYAPIVLDINGIIRLSTALTRVEERLSRLVNDSAKVNGYESPAIPEYSQWIVTMWHFGADASVEYTGDKFSATWNVGKNALIRAYSKDMGRDGKTRIRLERQEYPDKSLADAVIDKLSSLSQ